MFYDKYVKLCASVKRSPSAVAEEIGIKRSNVTHWKAGRNNPTDVTMAKIADYFGVTVEYLKGEEEQKENPGIPKDTEADALREEIFNLMKNAPAEQCRAYRDMLIIMLQQYEKR